jgi:hypothetical protein
MYNFNIRYRAVIEDSICIEADDVRDALLLLARKQSEEHLIASGVIQKFLITEVTNPDLDDY